MAGSGRASSQAAPLPSTTGAAPLTSGPAAPKPKKGRNFTPEEERQLCRSFLHVSQDPCVGNGQRKDAFWERITVHFNEHVTSGSRPARSLESKFHVIRHDVSKFGGCYAQVERLNVSGTNAEDTLEKALELYKIKAAKNSDFLFLHCWWLLKDAPKWADGFGGAKKTTPTKRSRAAEGSDQESDCVDMEAPVGGGGPEAAGSAGAGRTFKRPMGNRIAKEEHKQDKLRELAIRAQAAATKDMAAATWRKTELLQEQNVLMLFTTPDVQITDAGAREYLRLRREEELGKLRRRLEEDALLAEARRKAKEGANTREGREAEQPGATGGGVRASDDDDQWPEEESPVQGGLSGGLQGGLQAGLSGGQQDSQGPWVDNFSTIRSSTPTTSQAFTDSQEAPGQRGFNWHNDSHDPIQLDSEGTFSSGSRIDLNGVYCFGQERYNV